MAHTREQSELADAYRRVIDRIAAACRRSGRDPSGVQLVAVTKTVEPERIREAVDAGLTTFGENRVQEARPKVLAVVGATWHLIGPLQSNKARRAVELFDAIQSVDSVALAQRLDRLSGELRPRQGLPALMEVNVDRDPAKTGFDPSKLDRTFDELGGLENLRIDGLMTVGRQVASPEHARSTFRALRELSERLRASHAQLGPALSMGMTDDFEVAIEEGATIVRIGRAIFGERPHHHDGDEDHEH
jgi:pyridoxal phosphate enzyme (YggS family)